MNKKLLTRVLLPTASYPSVINWTLLLFRIAFGGAFLSHGWSKWSNFQILADTFPDPLGIGSSLSLGLAVFGEAVCSAAVILGLFHRIALLPMIFTMLVAFFIIHGSDVFAVKELAFVYLAAFGGLLIAGPGKFSADYLLFRKR